jgi:Glycosyl hydrolases family 43.
MGRDGSQTSTVLAADTLTGPYEIIRTGLRPLGMNAGDFDLAIAPDGKAYYYFERVHSETICADLTDDYTNVTGYYSTHFPHPNPPYVREATAHFARGNKHYLITSGTTAYLPNPSEVAIADTWHGPFTVLGDPHPGDASKTSYHSQVSSVFKVPGKKDLYIALADRWLPDLQHLRYDKYAEAIRQGFESDRNPTEWENPLPELAVDDKDTSIADYVWLPLRFEGKKVIIDWLDEWKIEDYE